MPSMSLGGPGVGDLTSRFDGLGLAGGLNVRDLLGPAVTTVRALPSSKIDQGAKCPWFTRHEPWTANSCVQINLDISLKR